jgi:diguanylate cyclase (GGDEF)-like protein
MSFMPPMNPEIAKIVNGENMPSPPTIAAKLLELVNQPDARIADITKVISADPKLSAKLIDYCNSPIVASARPVGSLQQAIPLLGMRTLRLLSLSFSVMDTQGREGFPYDEFWRRSLATAIAAKLIAKSAEQNADESFLLGLVFNIGVMGIANAYSDELAERFEIDDLLDSMTPEIEKEICGANRYEIGSSLLEKWHFPSEMIEAIHGYDATDQETPIKSTRLFSVSQEVGKLLLSSTPDNDRIKRVKQLANDSLGIDESQFETLFDQMIADWKGYETLFKFQSIAFDSIHDLETKAKESMVQLSLAMERTIREMSDQQDHLRQLAMMDSLTRLKNRSAFDSEVVKMTEGFRQRSQSFGLIIADIDHFKSFNDTYGHSAGDEVLREVADCLKKCCRMYDTVYRFGGEEFVILVGDCDYDATIKVAERLRLTIEEMQVDYDGNSLCVTASLGVCWVDRGRHESFDAIFQKADASLYEAKRKGRNHCVAITSSLKYAPAASGSVSPSVGVVTP